MSETISMLAGALIQFFFWIGVPALLLSLLCLVGLRYRSRAVLLLTLLGLFALGCFCLGLNLQGLLSGETLSLSRVGPTMIKKADGALAYWLTTGIWFTACGAGMLYCCRRFFGLCFKSG